MSDDIFGLPWSVGPHGTDVWCQSLKGGETRHIDIRGWGYLTGHGHGGLAMSAAEAITEQGNLAHRVVRAVNDEAALRSQLVKLTEERDRLKAMLGRAATALESRSLFERPADNPKCLRCDICGAKDDPEMGLQHNDNCFIAQIRKAALTAGRDGT